MDSITNKICSFCKVEKITSEFNKKTKSKDGLQYLCKQCNHIKSAEHYQDNKEYAKKRLSKNKKAAQEVARVYILDLLKNNGCVDCGEKDPIVLDFDHLKDKKYNIAAMLHNGNSIEMISKEVSKCEIRCANCHRRKTAKDFNWWKININYE